MKFYLTVFCLLIFSLTNAQTTFEISFNRDDFTISDNEGIVYIETTLNDRRVIGDTLSPNVPFFSYRIMVPDGIDSVSIQISYDKTEIAQNVKMQANPKPLKRDGSHGSAYTSRFAKRSVSVPVINAGVKHQSGRSYLLLNATPYLYDDSSGILYFVSNIHIVLNNLPALPNIRSLSIVELLSQSSPDMETENTEIFEGNDTIDYLIITNNSLAASFNDLVEWKRKKCLRSKIVTIEQLDTLYPQLSNTKTRIKAYILDYASPTKKKWVLLGGDKSIIPSTFYFMAFENATCYTDMYYATGSDYSDLNWDSNGNGMFGEEIDSVSLVPCVYLSRLPIRTAQQVLDYTHKLIDYEKGVGIQNNLLMAGSSLMHDFPGPKSDAHLLGELILDEFVTDYWSGDIKELFDTGSNYSFYINGDNLKIVIDSVFNVIHELSHGTFYEWSFGNGVSSYNDNQAQNQHNYPGSVIVTGACDTNRFEYEPCISKTLLRNPNGGAVSYLGCSGYGYGSDYWNHANGVSLMYSDQYDGHFLKYLYTGLPSENAYSFASIVTEAKTTVFNEFSDNDTIGIYRFLMMGINPMGDPEMQIWTDTIHSFSSNPMVVDPIVGVSLLGNVTVSTSVSGCTIAALDEHGTRFVNNNTSTATFVGLNGLTNIVVMKHNYKPYMKTLYVDDWSGGGTLPLFIHASHIGNHLIEVSLVESEDSSQEQEMNDFGSWFLQIVETSTGDVKTTQMVNSRSCRIDTTGWASGIYGFQAIKDGKTTNIKLYIR